MANRAYVRFWTRDNSPALLLDRFERLLETVPVSATGPGFTRVTLRAIAFSETPLIERDLRGFTSSAADVIGMVREHSDEDTACEVEASWDLWGRDPEQGIWQLHP